VKREKYIDTHEYTFELSLEINRALLFSSGEVTNLVLDALFALDKQGLLFPGVTTPEKRLLSAGMEATGYERSAAPAGGVSTRLMNASETRSKGKHAFKDGLWEAVSRLDTAVLHQRMLMAKLHGLADKYPSSAFVSEADQALAKGLIAATEAIAAAVEASAKPVL